MNLERLRAVAAGALAIGALLGMAGSFANRGEDARSLSFGVTVGRQRHHARER